MFGQRPHPLFAPGEFLPSVEGGLHRKVVVHLAEGGDEGIEADSHQYSGGHAGMEGNLPRLVARGGTRRGTGEAMKPGPIAGQS